MPGLLEFSGATEEASWDQRNHSRQAPLKSPCPHSQFLILCFAMRLYNSANKSMRKGSAGTRCLSPGLRIYIFVLLLLHRKIKKCPNKNNIYRPELVSPSQKKGNISVFSAGSL